MGATLPYQDLYCIKLRTAKLITPTTLKPITRRIGKGRQSLPIYPAIA